MKCGHDDARLKYGDKGPLVCRVCEADRHKLYRLRQKGGECRKGHPRTDENTRWTKKRGKWSPVCKICQLRNKGYEADEKRELGTLLPKGPPWTWRNAHYADGPKTVEWIREMDFLPEHPEEYVVKALNKWSKPGARASVYAVDYMLVRHGHHLFETPDELWVGGYELREPQRANPEALKQLRDRKWLEEQYKTQTAADIARELDCDPRTVRYALHKHSIHRNGTKLRCVNGHIYTPETTYYKTGGGKRWKACKICRRERQDRSNERRRERRRQRGHSTTPTTTTNIPS